MAYTSGQPGSVSSGGGFRRFGLIGCSLASVFLLATLAAILFFVYRTPYWKNMAGCRNNIQQVGDALGRYAIKNDAYPDKLTDLVPDYISAKLLKCPADKSREAVSYLYRKPEINAPGDTVLIECDLHVLRPDMPASKIVYLKKGVVDLKTPGLNVR